MGSPSEPLPVSSFLFALLNGLWIRRGSVGNEAYSRTRRAYELLKKQGPDQWNKARTIASKHPLSREIWEESLEALDLSTA
jgi:hypothetical protein